MVILIIVIVLILLLLGIFIPLTIYNNKYKKFVLLHSESLKRLSKINNNYGFLSVPNCDMSNAYDNENFYNDISPKDYLTYELVHKEKYVLDAISKASKNKKIFDKYKEEINAQCKLGHFDTIEILNNTNKLNKIETKLFYERIKTPVTKLDIRVTIVLTNINKSFITKKRQTFEEFEILDIISKLRRKTGSYYLFPSIWNSICKVERGKVSNRMRFSIYERDHYRCCMCGRHTNDLEIDHIIPISKGGKSTYDNLQTLCHRCNVEKGNDIY